MDKSASPSQNVDKQVLEKVDRHWWYGCCGGKYGKFPANYLISIDVPLLEDGHEIFAAIADFPRQQDGDLSFAKGELIVGISQVNENWWYGKINERTGIFPTTHAWQLDSKPFKAKTKVQVMNMKARVKMSMKAQLDEEMDLHEGDIITITEVIDKNWYRGICGNQEGIFPSAYVEILDDTDLMGDNGVSQSTDFNLPVQFTEPSHVPPRVKSNSDVDSLLALSPEAQFPLPNEADIFNDDYFKVNMPSMYYTESHTKASETETLYNAQPLVELDVVPYGITLYPFYAQFENELSFHEGEIVTLCRHIDKDWIEGKIDGKKGIFPKSYVNILVDCENYTSSTRDLSCDVPGEAELFSQSDMNSQSELMPNMFAKVLYNFDAQMNGDLTIHKDEVVWIVSKANDDWCEVKNQSGNVGLCPKNYLSPHLLPNEMRNRLLRGTSLAKDNLIGVFSTVKENVSYDLESQDVIGDRSRRKYMSHDFPAESLSSKERNNIEDLMSKNLESYHNMAQTSNLIPSQRHSIDITETVAGRFMQQEETEKSKNAKFHWPPSLPQAVEEETHWKEDEVQLRHPPKKPPPPPPQYFQRHDVGRHSTDRIPHRPAPPVPVPGQKPVRRSIHRSASSENIIEEEKAGITEEQTENIYSLPIIEDQRRKNAEQRQNVISELVMTEKEYVRDLKITYETFNLHNPRILEARGIDVKVVFGNILEVMQLAEDLLDKLQLAMKGKDDDEQLVGPCFVELADKMKNVYGQYCMNHNNALILLEKYESVEEIQNLFKKGIETLRMQVACFDMGSILIKPVQRILKYPLILNELIKCTEDSHKDKPELLNAVRTMMDVATYINEYKRRKDIVSKYLDDGNTTISSRMSRISLHSVAKKSTRLGVMLTSTLFGVSTKDPVFDEHEFIFHTVEKTCRSFLKDVEIFLCGMQEKMMHQLNIGSLVAFFYQESNSEVQEFHKLHQLVCKRFWEEFRKTIEKRVLFPLNTLMDLFQGPQILIQKRHDKLLDYDGCCAKAEKNKENRLIQEELLATKSNYEALNSHLLEELPALNSLACEVLVECLAAFITARKMLSGKITKEYLALMEVPFMKSSQGDAIETFAVKHSLVWNQLVRFSFSPKNIKVDTLTKRSSKLSPVPSSKQLATEPTSSSCQVQSGSQQAYLQSRYPQDMVYCCTQSYTAVQAMELTVSRGNVVAVIKKHNPLGDSRMWFVDDGSTKGFLPSSCLEPLYRHANSSSPVAEQTQTKTSVTRMQSQPPTQQQMLQPQPPPPSYDEVVSSADSSPQSERSRTSAESHMYEEIPEASASSVYENIPDSGSESPAGFYYAVYDFEGGGMHMLSIKSGQAVHVLQQRDLQGNSEWWFVEDRFGRKGYVPGNFLKKYQQ
ncbi:dynamin-binding protein-like isoform X2 [Periplaneta americana]|uniref:dynamin-binding protein-like isoform X2 n=1 Tax=Periplaneta americana TaxID=6978 RepID=UPI0037E96AD1